MDLLCIGLNHRTAPVGVREKFAYAESALGEISAELARLDGITEGVVVSTCNRVEFYVAAKEGARGLEVVRTFIEGRAGEPMGEAFVRRVGSDSIRHLFRVVCGLDSMVLGETEILGQV